MPPKPPKPTKPRAPPSDADGSLEIEIDPELLEAALASVERHMHHRPAPAVELPADNADTDAGVTIELDDLAGITVAPRDDDDDDDPGAVAAESLAPTPAVGASDATLRLQVQVREATQQAKHFEEELVKMTKLRDAAEQQLSTLRKVAREAQADFDRFRARTRKDREDAERSTEERLLREVLETGDNLERAWQHAMSQPDSLLGGLQMIVEQFRGVLRRLGVERIDAVSGTVFDPEIHEAVMHVRTASVAPGSVVDEVSPGYRLRGRLFRPTRVTVAAPPLE